MVDTTWRRSQRSVTVEEKKANLLDLSNATKQSSPIKEVEPVPISMQTTVKTSTPHKSVFNPTSSSTPNLARRAAQRASIIKTPTLPSKRATKLFEPATETGWATIKDLKLEEKQKIANLVSELAKANKEKEEMKSELEQLRSEKESEIDDLKDNNTQLIQDLANLQKKFNHSLSLLKNYQEKLQVKGTPSPIAKQSPVNITVQKPPKDDTKLDMLQAEIIKLKQVVANQEQAILNLSKTHSSIEQTSNSSIDNVPPKSPVANIFQANSYVTTSLPENKSINFDKYLAAKGASGVTLLQSNNKRRLRTMIENSQPKKEEIEQVSIPAIEPERELKSEKPSNQSIQPRHVRFSNSEAELTPNKTFRMSKLLSIQGKREAPLSEANNGQKMTAQMNGSSKNVRNAPVVEQEEEMLIKSIEKQQGVKQVKEIKKKSESKWESFDRHWEDFESYVNKPKWAEVREDSKSRKTLQNKESEVSYDKSLIDLIDELESENL